MIKRTITVSVKTNSKEIKIEKINDQFYKVKLSAVPKEGRANKQLIASLADYFKIASSQIAIKSGKTSKTKLLVISG